MNNGSLKQPAYPGLEIVQDKTTALTAAYFTGLPCIDCPIARKEIKLVEVKKRKPSGKIINRGMYKTVKSVRTDYVTHK